MEKKAYERPVAEVVDIECESLMIQASVKSVLNGDGFIFGGPGTGGARGKGRRSEWESDWEE